MSVELNDALLDLLWDRYLNGRSLPPDISAQATPTGPEIWLRLPGMAYRFLRADRCQNNPIWQTLPLLH
jgi:hypothetical protein